LLDPLIGQDEIARAAAEHPTASSGPVITLVAYADQLAVVLVPRDRVRVEQAR
jgi:hypothetical protein